MFKISDWKSFLPFAIIMLALSAEAATLSVCPGGCGYESIGAAITAASPGDVVEVWSGTYYERVNVTKPMTLRGLDSGSGTPVIDAEDDGSPVTLASGRATLEGFVIKGSGSKSPGIAVASGNNKIYDNEISYNEGDGIRIERYGTNVISENVLAYNGRNGVLLDSSNNNVLRENTFSFNKVDGLRMDESSSNALIENVAQKNVNGIYLDHSSNNELQGNELLGNSRDGIALYYSNENTMDHNNASHNYNGIHLTYSANNEALNNAARYNHQDGIRLVSSEGNLQTGNLLEENGIHDAYDDRETNSWDDGQTGNLYGSYDCTDADKDGICDLSYAVPGGQEVDRYPMAVYRAKEGPGPGYTDVLLETAKEAGVQEAESPQEYLFIELWTRENGTALEGTPMKIMIDFPTYHLRGTELMSDYLVILPSIRAILGTGLSLHGDLGGGASSGLYPVTDLPHTSENLTILRVEGGVAALEYEGRSLTLMPGDVWKGEITEIRQEDRVTLEVTKTVTIANHGNVSLVRETAGIEPPGEIL